MGVHLNPDLFVGGNSHLHSPGADARDCSIKFSKQSQTHPTIERFTVHSNWCMEQKYKAIRFQASDMWFVEKHDSEWRCSLNHFVQVSSQPENCITKAA